MVLRRLYNNFINTNGLLIKPLDKIFFKYLSFLEIKKFIKYTFGGIISLGLKMILTFFLTEILSLWYFYSYIFSLIMVISFNFFFNIYITFKCPKKKFKKFIKYMFFLIIFYCSDALLVKFLTETIQFHYLISILFVTTFIFIIKFFVYDKLVFTK